MTISMKILPSGLQAHLDGGATTLCWCWRLTRGDGAMMGFTDHDRPLTFDGVTYQAASGFTASEVQSSLGLAVDNLTVSGALSSAALNEADLAAGLYDGATIAIWRVNWCDTDQRVLMRSGTLGEVTRTGNAFQAEVRGLAQALNQPVGRVFGHLCDATLGDARCGLVVTPTVGAVTAVTDARRFTVSGLDDATDGDFTGGLVTFASGANSNRSGEIKRQTGSMVELWQAMSEPVAVGDAVTVTPGCDKQFTTCRTRFANTANFRGFPHMPGNDAVIAGPSLNQPLDGRSRYGN
jgi:uncharacterized phage protein (TIGR02218 family)